MNTSEALIKIIVCDNRHNFFMYRLTKMWVHFQTSFGPAHGRNEVEMFKPIITCEMGWALCK